MAQVQEDKAARKRAAEAARREEMKRTVEAYASRGLDLTVTDAKKLTGEQRARAVTAGAGLRGKAFLAFVIDGKKLGQQADEAAQARRVNGAVEKRVRRAKDPEAAELATRAKESAPGIKSKFRSYEMRQLLDEFSLTPMNHLGGKPGTILVERRATKTDYTFGRKDLELFRDGEDFAGKTEVRKAIAELTDGLKLWGRKFAAALLVKAGR